MAGWIIQSGKKLLTGQAHAELRSSRTRGTGRAPGEPAEPQHFAQPNKARSRADTCTKPAREPGRSTTDGFSAWKKTEKQNLCPGEKNSPAQGPNSDPNSFPKCIKVGWKDPLPSKSSFLHPKYITEEVLKNNHHMKVFLCGLHFPQCQAVKTSPKRLMVFAEAKSELEFHQFSNKRFYE